MRPLLHPESVITNKAKDLPVMNDGVGKPAKPPEKSQEPSLQLPDIPVSMNISRQIGIAVRSVLYKYSVTRF